MKNLTDSQKLLETMQYDSFTKVTTKSTAVKLASLVPTIGASDEHIKIVYYQIQIWLGDKALNPSEMH